MKLDIDGSEVEELFGFAEEGLESSEQLNCLQTLVKNNNNDSTISTESYQFFNIALKNIADRLGYSSEQIKQVSLEDINRRTMSKSIALESIKTIAKDIWDKLVKILKTIKDKIIAFFKKLMEYISGTKKKAEENKKQKIDDNAPIFKEKTEHVDHGTITIPTNYKTFDHSVNMPNRPYVGPTDFNKIQDRIEASLMGINRNKIETLILMVAYKQNRKVSILKGSDVLSVIESCISLAHFLNSIIPPYLEFIQKEHQNEKDYYAGNVAIKELIKSKVPSDFNILNIGKHHSVFGTGFGIKITIDTNEGFDWGLDNLGYTFSISDEFEYSHGSINDLKAEICDNSMKDKISEGVVNASFMILDNSLITPMISKTIDHLRNKIKSLISQDKEDVSGQVQIIRAKVRGLSSVSSGLNLSMRRIERILTNANYYNTISIDLAKIQI